jgi:hypothetical protein
MAEARFPVDITNPGQVFACLGFMEAAEDLLGGAYGGFFPAGFFTLGAHGEADPVAEVLRFLAEARVFAVLPNGQSEAELDAPAFRVDAAQWPEWGWTSAPAVLVNGAKTVPLDHWCDATDREPFKLYSGNRGAPGIMMAMVEGLRGKPRKGATLGEIEQFGVAQLFENDPEGLIKDPLGVVTPVGGSFNMDRRGGWSAIDAGYSPNDQGHAVAASPIVEALAVWGLQHARPRKLDRLSYRFGVWEQALPLCLARPALAGDLPGLTTQTYRFALLEAGKNKVVAAASKET